MNYSIRDNLIYSIDFTNIDKKTVKIAAFDLDHTIIRPKNNKVFPKSKEDFELVFPDVIDLLNNLVIDKYIIIIISNQSDLNNKEDKKDIVLGRIDYLYSLFPKFNIIMATKQDYYRKPNTGMWDFVERKLNKRNIKIDKKNSFYVGDAAGRLKINKLKKDFACSDRMFALNVKIDFFTPETYFRGTDLRELNKNYICVNRAEELFKFSQSQLKLNSEKIEKIKKFNIIILIGPPASGKSEFSNKLTNYNIINQDNLKTKTNTLNEMKKILKDNINSKIVLDNTNGTLKYRKTFTDYLTELKLEYCFVKLLINKEQSFLLNNYRCNLLKKERLPDVVIHTYYKKYNEPKNKEGYTKLFELDFIPKYKNKTEENIFYQYY